MLAASTIPAAPVLALMAFAVLVTMVGHVVKARFIVVLGLMLLFLSTAAMLVGGYAAYQDDPSDPRRPSDPTQPKF